MQDPALTFSPMASMQIVSNVRLSRPVFEQGRWHYPSWVSATALWDTAAAVSAVTRELANRLGMTATERTTLWTASGMLDVCKGIVYLELKLDAFVIPVKAAVVDTIPGTGNDFLIGMDVIRFGTLTIAPDEANSQFRATFVPLPGAANTAGQLLKLLPSKRRKRAKKRKSDFF